MKIGLSLALLIAVSVGCGRVEQVLPSKDGLWTSNSIAYRSFLNSTVDSSWVTTNVTTYAFDKGGSGSTLDSSGVSQVFTWSINADGDIFTICRNSSSSQSCQDHLVVTNEKNVQGFLARIPGVANGTYLEYDLVLNRIQ